MKNLKVILFAIILVCAYTLQLRTPTHQVDPITAKVAAEGLTKVIEKVIEDPYKAGKIPTDFIQGGIDGITSLFEGANKLKDRTRSLQLTFQNFVPYQLLLVNTHFDSGTFFISLPPVQKPKSLTYGFVANKQGSWFTGVSGGLTFQIGNTGKYLVVGFTNPYMGGYKFYGELLDRYVPAKYGYDRSRNNYPILQNRFGFRLTVTQVESQRAKMGYVYILTKL